MLDSLLTPLCSVPLLALHGGVACRPSSPHTYLPRHRVSVRAARTPGGRSDRHRPTPSIVACSARASIVSSSTTWRSTGSVIT